MRPSKKDLQKEIKALRERLELLEKTLKHVATRVSVEYNGN